VQTVQWCGFDHASLGRTLAYIPPKAFLDAGRERSNSDINLSMAFACHVARVLSHDVMLDCISPA